MTQRKNYKAKTQIMSDKNIYDEWTKFEDDYSDALKDVDEKWYDNLNELDIFLEKYKKRPNKRSIDTNEKKLGEWIGKQIQNLSQEKNNMKKENIKNDFIKFMDKWKTIF